jgi:hypothetical protein
VYRFDGVGDADRLGAGSSHRPIMTQLLVNRARATITGQFLGTETQTKKSIADIGISTPSAKLI